MGLTQITTGGVDDNINIDSNTLKVDGTNNRVGIGTASPNGKFVVSNGGAESFEFYPADASNVNKINYYNRSGTVYCDAVQNAASHQFQIQGTEKIRIDSSGRVLVGGTSTYHANADDLVVQGTGQVGVTIASTSTGKSNLFFADSTSNPGTYACYFEYDHSADALKIGQGNSERIRIDSSGRVGIGETALSSFNSIADDLVISQASGSAGITIRSGTSGSGTLAFTDGANTTFRGDIRYVHNGDYMRFTTAGDERMRLTNSGDLGLGTTNPTQKLDVRGSVYVGTNIGVNTTTPASRIHIKGGSLTVEHNSANTGTGQFNINVENNSQTSFSYDDEGSVVIGTSATPSNQGTFSEKLRINSAGQLLLGTSTVPSNTLGDVSVIQTGPSVTKTGYHASVGTSFTSIPGATVGNETSVYLVAIRAIGDGNFYSSATFILNSAAYSKTFTQLGSPANHFGNGTLSAQLSSSSTTSASVQVKRSGSGLAAVHVHMLRLL